MIRPWARACVSASPGVLRALALLLAVFTLVTAGSAAGEIPGSGASAPGSKPGMRFQAAQSSCPSPNLRAGKILPVPSSPHAVAIGDFTGDGNLDLAVASVNLGGVSIYLGDGKGDFLPAASLLDGQEVYFVAAADFNEDGKLDLAVRMLDTAFLFLGDGSGGFTQGPSIPLPPYYSYGLATADLNGDGHADLVLLSYNGENTGGLVSGFLGDGTGSFTPGPGAVASLNPTSMTVADFNGDGLPDVAVSGDDGATILLSDGAGGFTGAGTFAAGWAPMAIAAGDFNGDGAPDLALANRLSHDVSILIGDGHGGFGSPTNYAAGLTAELVTVADFDRDGHLDVVVANDISSDLMIFRGDGSGGFTLAPARFAVQRGVSVLATADLDGNGDPDLVVGYQAAVAILLGDGASGFLGEAIFPVGVQPREAAVADVNGDGKLDLVTANVVSNSVSVVFGDGTGRFGPPSSFPAGTGAAAVAIADFNGDGKPDLAVANTAEDTVSVLLNDGAGGFGAARKFPVGHQPLSVAAADFNGDGKADLAVANPGTNDVSILLGTGTGSFGPASSLPVGVYPWDVLAADFNRDDRMDLAVADNGGGVWVLLGDGTGHFAYSSSFAAPGAVSVASGDFNGDGFLDLAAAEGGTNTGVTVSLGDGQGGFGPSTELYVGVWFSTAVAAGDVTGDGRVDLVVTNGDYSFMDVFAGDGAGGFTLTDTEVAGGSPSSATLIDVDGDGRLDVVMAAAYSNGVSVLLNETFTVLPASLPVALLNVPYAATMTTAGGAAPVTLSFIGALPAGLSFDPASATISGSPGQLGSFPISVEATGSDGCVTTHAYSLVVSLVETRVAVASSSSQSVFGQTLTITATVTTVPPGSGTPTGSVTFTVDGVEQPPVDLVDGVATLRLTGLSIGAHTIVASYSGDGTHTPSTSSVFSQIVFALSSIPALGLPGAALLALLLAIGGFRLARG